jgi:cell division septation protein DedD
LLQTIKDMGLPVTLSPGPNNFTRVLVGPYSDTATMAHVKTQLENAGLHPVKHTQ